MLTETSSRCRPNTILDLERDRSQRRYYLRLHASLERSLSRIIPSSLLQHAHAYFVGYQQQSRQRLPLQVRQRQPQLGPLAEA